MISASVHLDRLLCHVSPEDAAEPYMWTAFFYADRNTINMGPGQQDCDPYTACELDHSWSVSEWHQCWR